MDDISAPSAAPHVAPTSRVIGDWLADPTTLELRRGSEVVRLEPKVMGVLMLLAERPGGVVGRDELFSMLWPGVVVGDEALTQSVIKLRRALGDNPRDPVYIETISKRGYRLIAPVGQGVESHPAAGAAARAGDDASGRGRRDRTASGRRALPAIVAVLVIVSAIFVAFRKPPGDVVPMPATEPPDRAAVTLVMLPFEIVGSEDEQRYLARGIANDLATELSRLPHVRVIRSADTDRATSAEGGAATYVLSGSVQRAGPTLRIIVHVVEGDTRRQLWSERFERPFGEVFAVQDEIIGRVGALLPEKLASAARERVARRHTRSLEAYDDFLRAQALFLVRQPAANEEARALYRRAITTDPQFARAYAGLAMTHAIDPILRPMEDAAQGLARAAELAETARTIDPELAEVHWAMGFVDVQRRRHEAAVASLRKAIELNPSFADAYALMGGVRTYVGRPAEAIPLLRTAMRLNPDAGYLYYLLLGRAYLFQGDVEQALINLREAAARNPVNVETRLYLAAALVAAGQGAAAQWEAEEIRTLEPGFALERWLANHPLAEAGQRARFRDLLRPLDL